MKPKYNFIIQLKYNVNIVCMNDCDMMRFSFTYFFMSYDYVILKIKSKKHSLKDLIDYKPPKGLIYIKLKQTN